MFCSGRLVCFALLPLLDVTSVVTNVFRSAQNNEMRRHNVLIVRVFVMVSPEVCLQPSPEGVIISYLLSFQPKGAAVTKPYWTAQVCKNADLCISF